MPRKLMVNLYYISKQPAREDCDILGIDRRRVRAVRQGFETRVWDEEAGEMKSASVVAMLRVDAHLVERVGVEALHNDDSEETW